MLLCSNSPNIYINIQKCASGSRMTESLKLPPFASANTLPLSFFHAPSKGHGLKETVISGSGPPFEFPAHLM